MPQQIFNHLKGNIEEDKAFRHFITFSLLQGLLNLPAAGVRDVLVVAIKEEKCNRTAWLVAQRDNLAGCITGQPGTGQLKFTGYASRYLVMQPFVQLHNWHLVMQPGKLRIRAEQILINLVTYVVTLPNRNSPIAA